MKNSLKNLLSWLLERWLAVGVIAALFLAVASAMQDLFAAYVNRMDAGIYALTMAAALVGLPFYMGRLASELEDNGSEGEKKMIRRGFRLALIAVVLASVMAVGLRLAELQTMYYHSRYMRTDDVLAGVCVAAMPVLNALLAFAVSWFAFRKQDSNEALDDMGGADS